VKLIDFMIVAEINGGIGNQLFQYASAKSLSLFHKTELKLNVNPFGDKFMPGELRSRPFDLHHFNIPEIPADNSIGNSFLKVSFFQKILQNLKPNYKRKIYKEPFFHFDPHFFEAGNNIYLKGLRQSEKYFKLFETEIRTILKFKDAIVNQFYEIGKKINNENSISVHIRRGDYLAKISMEVLGLLPIEYYQNAISLMKSKVNTAKLYFFSDDIEWVKENFNIPDAEFISGSITSNHIEDLYLMSQCHHNIIANSSFSWWGAWLNNNPDKIVIAPGKWFNKGPKDTQDLVPPGWIKI